MGRLNASCVDEIAERPDWRAFLDDENRLVNQLIAGQGEHGQGGGGRTEAEQTVAGSVQLVLVERALGTQARRSASAMHQIISGCAENHKGKEQKRVDRPRSTARSPTPAQSLRCRRETCSLTGTAGAAARRSQA